MRAHARLAAYVACVALTTGVGGAACSYDPHPVDGTLRCASTGECPEGYSCSACSTCWSNDIEGGIGGQLSGSALPQPLLNRYVGDWALNTCANVVTRCGGGSPGTTLLSPDSANPSIMALDPGSLGSADLVSDWLCVLDLSLNSGGAHLYGADQWCTLPNVNPELPNLLQNTWTAKKFKILITSDTTAIHTALYERVDKFVTGPDVHCIQHVHAPMTKL